MNTTENQLLDLALRLKQIRKTKKMTQTVFAQMGKVSVQSQKLYEAGKRPPNSEYLQNLSKMGIDACYILVGQSTNHEQHSNEGFNREMLVEILEIIERFSEKKEKPFSITTKVDLASLFYVPFTAIGKVDKKIILAHLKHVN